MKKIKLKIRSEPTLNFHKFRFEIEQVIEYKEGELSKQVDKIISYVNKKALDGLNQIKEIVGGSR